MSRVNGIRPVIGGDVFEINIFTALPNVKCLISSCRERDNLEISSRRSLQTHTVIRQFCYHIFLRFRFHRTMRCCTARVRQV